MNALDLTVRHKHAVRNAAVKIEGNVAFSTSDDVDSVFSYYRDNQHAHVDERDQEQLAQETCDGRLLLIRAEGRIVAASSAFNYGASKTHEGPAWTEIGATRVTLGGFGFYPFIIASQVIEECLERTPEAYIFANIYEDNKAVQHLLGHKTGWDTFSVSQDAALEAAYSSKNRVTAEEMNTWAWLRSRPNCLPHQAQIVRNVIADKGFLNLKDPNNPKTLHLDLTDFSLARPEIAQKLEVLAHGGFADYLVQHGENLSCKDVMEAVITESTNTLTVQI